MEVNSLLIEENDDLQDLFSKYGALALEKQGILLGLVGSAEPELDIEKGIEIQHPFPINVITQPSTRLDYDELEREVLKDIRKKCRSYLKTNNFEELLKNNDKMNKIQVDLEKQLEHVTYNIELEDKSIIAADLNYDGDVTKKLATGQILHVF